MQKIINYFMQEQNVRHQLDEKVRELIAQGWQPLGGVAHTGHSYIQAMVLYESPTKSS